MGDRLAKGEATLEGDWPSHDVTPFSTVVGQQDCGAGSIRFDDDPKGPFQPPCDRRKKACGLVECSLILQPISPAEIAQSPRECRIKAAAI